MNLLVRRETAIMYEKVRLMYGMRFRKHYKSYDSLIKLLHNKHQGRCCFIIGTGPSLNKTNFSTIKNEILIGVNNLYMGSNYLDINPQYWCVADAKIFHKYSASLLNLKTALFLTDGAGQFYLHYKNRYKDAKYEPIVARPLSDMKTTQSFSTNMLKGINGGMVTLSCLQIAYWMGFNEVYLVGCDCTSKGKHYDKSVNVDAQDDYWEHFFKLYEVCKKVYDDDNRKIYNSTVGGNLEVFERVKLEDISNNKFDDYSIFIGDSEPEAWMLDRRKQNEYSKEEIK